MAKLSLAHEPGIRRYVDRMILNTEPPAWVSMITQQIRSPRGQEKLVFRNGVGQMQPWNGRITYESMTVSSFEVKTEDFMHGIQWPGKDWRRLRASDVGGPLVQEQIDEFGVAVQGEHWEDLAIATMVGAESAVCYDGQYFFDTDHPTKTGTQSNDTTSDITTANAPTVSEFAAGLLAAWTKFKALVDNTNRPQNARIRKVLIVVPSNMELVALQALSLQFIPTSGGGMQNNPVLAVRGVEWVLESSVKLSLQSGFDAKFFLFAVDDSMGRKPLVSLEEHFEQNTLLTDSEHYKKEDQVLINAKASRSYGLGNYRSAHMHTFT